MKLSKFNVFREAKKPLSKAAAQPYRQKQASRKPLPLILFGYLHKHVSNSIARKNTLSTPLEVRRGQQECASFGGDCEYELLKNVTNCLVASATSNGVNILPVLVKKGLKAQRPRRGRCAIGLLRTCGKIKSAISCSQFLLEVDRCSEPPHPAPPFQRKAQMRARELPQRP